MSVFILCRQRPCDGRYVVQGGPPNVCKVPEPWKRKTLDRIDLSFRARIIIIIIRHLVFPICQSSFSNVMT
jgi:hypothetical protein